MSTLGITAAIFVTCLMACEKSPREELIGTWRSDRDETLVNVEKCDCVTPDVRAWLEQNLGKMTLEYTATTVTAEMPGWKASGPYKVLTEGENWLELEEPETEASTGRVWIEGDRLRVHVKVGFDEVFRRLP